MLFATAVAAHADVFRIATWNVELARKGPGLLLRDISRGEDEQFLAVLDVIEATSPDVLLLQGVDYDYTNEVLRQFADAAGYAHFFAFPPNSGRASGLDIDMDGRLGEPEDALGFGRFFGEGGMALLSSYPIATNAAQDFSRLLWKDIPNTMLPAPNTVWPDQPIHDALPLASMGHWSVPILFPDQDLTLLAFHASPPVFDGPEDRNGLRNHDQITFWQSLLSGKISDAPATPFVLLGDANQDPKDGDGRKDAIRSLLADPRLQDPAPTGAEGTDTVDWEAINVGKLRVDYVLPSSELTVVGSGVHWPPPDTTAGETASTASRHHLVWVDLDLSNRQ